VALKPLHDRAKIKRVVVATYQSVSGAGKDAMDELFARPARSSSPIRSRRKKFTKRIAFNVIPHIDVFMDDGFTKEEWKMVAETKKILDPEDQARRDLRARAGVHRPFRGGQHRVREPITADEARDILREAPGCLVIDKREDGGYVTPSRRPARTRPISAASARTRRSRTASRCGCVSDNLRKGAALNAIQIAEA
jgi:aspartate-semialdehyde dehydrogenase